MTFILSVKIWNRLYWRTVMNTTTAAIDILEILKKAGYIYFAIMILIVAIKMIKHHYIMTNSEAIRYIRQFNRRYLKQSIAKTRISIKLSSLKEFNSYKYDTFRKIKPLLLQYMNHNFIYKNAKQFRADNITPNFINIQSIKGFYKLFAKGICKKEQEMYQKYRTPIVVEYRYTSPAGRNRYSAIEVFSIESLYKMEYYERNKDTFAEQKKTERAKMTKSLRYDILRRDNFTCQICGATQKDGAKLQVDHIKPVSRGGKTVANNLRVLCGDCNLGKSSKYTKNGIN